MEAGFFFVDVVAHVVADKQIEPPVPVVIDKRRRYAPGSIVGTALLREVGERAIAVVAEQLAAFEVGHVEIDAAIVVEVASRRSHRVSAYQEPACGGDIGKT